MQSLPPFHVGGTIYFEFQTKKPSDGVTPIAPNSTPTVTVYKNGSATGESATIASLSGVTGGYSVSLNPAGDAEADNYILKVEAGITDSDFNGGSPFTHPEWFHTRCIGLISALQGADGDTLETLSDQIDGIEGGGNTTVTVLPATGIVANRSAGVTLLPVVGETISQAITVYQSDGTTAVNLSGKTLRVVFETMSGVDVAVVQAADISIGGTGSNVVTFAYPSAVTASERTLRFALSDAAAPLTMREPPPSRPRGVRLRRATLDLYDNRNHEWASPRLTIQEARDGFAQLRLDQASLRAPVTLVLD
jgi:hypothetical protein